MLASFNLTIPTYSKKRNISNSNKTLSFNGYKGFRAYGTETDRKAVNYVLRHTVPVIEETLEKSESRDIGLVKSYIGLTQQDYPGILGTFGGLQGIFKDYLETYRKRCAELKVQNPEGTDVFLLTRMNIIKNTPKLFDATRKHMDDLREDLVDILDNYWENGIRPLSIGYADSAEHIQDRLYSGYPPHEQIRNQLDLSVEKVAKTFCTARDNIVGHMLPDFQEDSKALYDFQQNRQLKRVFKSAAIGTLLNLFEHH